MPRRPCFWGAVRCERMADESLTDVDAPAGAALLEYASPPAVRETWGPLVFRPSRRSWMLLVLLGVATVWLGLRHEPWRRVGTVPGDLAVGPAFTGDNLVLAFDSRAGANLFDPATGRRVRNVLPRVDPTTDRYYVLAGGRQILVLPYNDRTARVYDVGSGRVVERVVNPDGLGSQLLLVAPDGPRLLTLKNGSDAKSSATTRPFEVTYWDLTRSPPTTRPVRTVERGSDLQFSPDGRRILAVGIATGDVKLLDGRTMDVIDEARGNGAPVDGGFLGTGERFWVQWTTSSRANAKTQPNPKRFELRSSATGETLATMPIPAGLLPMYTKAFTVSDDGRQWAMLAPAAPGSALGWPGQWGVTLYVGDVASGRVLLRRRDNTADWPLLAFPGSNRLLAGDLSTRQPAVFAPPHEQPVAVLPGSGPFAGPSTTAEISPDGRTILTRTNGGPAALAVPESVVTLYRPGGWDCPESHLGVLAFPQTWGAAVLLALLAFSLTGDARRARRASARRPVATWLVAGMLLLALPPTMHHVVAGLIGGPWVHSPAPLLVLLAILLATNARAWRAVAIVAFCGLIPLLAWGGYLLHKAGLSSEIPYRFLDRNYDVPVRLPLAAVAGLAVFVLVGLFHLLRPRPAAM